MALLNFRSMYLQRKDLCSIAALSQRRRQNRKENVRQTVDEEAKAGTKRSVTRGAYTDYTPEDRVKIGRYAAENGPARATRHFAMPETTGRRLKSK